MDARVGPLSVGNLHHLPHRRQGARAEALGDHHAARLQRVTHQHQRARQVVERIERAEAEDVAICALVRLLFVELVRAQALDGEFPRLQRGRQLSGDIANDQRRSRFGAGEVEAFEYILDHVVEHEPRGISGSLPGERAVVAGQSAVGCEDAGDGTFGHRACLHWGRRAA